MIRVLFVCHGNICRSPMAEFIFKDMVSKQGLSDRFYIASAATSTEEIWNGIGNPVYPPAREELAKIQRTRLNFFWITVMLRGISQIRGIQVDLMSHIRMWWRAVRLFWNI